MLEQYGVPATLERGGRYFPTSNKSVDVLKAFRKWNEEKGVKLLTGQQVEKLLVRDRKIYGVQSNGREHVAANVVLATGGMSYPATGSNGQGYELAKTVGHSNESVRPSLVPIETEGDVADDRRGHRASRSEDEQEGQTSRPGA